MDITIPVTVTKPGGTIQTPFGPKEVGDQSQPLTVTLHIDEATAKVFADLLK